MPEYTTGVCTFSVSFFFLLLGRFKKQKRRLFLLQETRRRILSEEKAKLPIHKKYHRPPCPGLVFYTMAGLLAHAFALKAPSQAARAQWVRAFL